MLFSFKFILRLGVQNLFCGFLGKHVILRFFGKACYFAVQFSGYNCTLLNRETLYFSRAKGAETQHETGALVILANTNPYQGMDYLKKRWPRLHYVRFKSVEEAQELETAIRQQLY